MYTFDNYNLINHIQRKTGRDIYRVYPASTPEQMMLLKIFDTECLLPTTTLDDIQRMDQRLQQLKHPHIVAIRELGIAQEEPYVVSTYLAYGSLRRYLDQRSLKRLSIDEAVGVVMQVGQAVAFAHEQEVLHLHIRPESIRLNRQGEVLLTNFSLSNILDEERLEDKRVTGIHGYLAPEQIVGMAGPASDQYALGYLLYELITGTQPTTKDVSALWQRSDQTVPVAPTTLVPSLSHAIEVVILQALAMHPRERYTDIPTFLAELKAATHPAAPAFPFAHLTASFQKAAEKQENTEDTFPLLIPLHALEPDSSELPTALPPREHNSQTRHKLLKDEPEEMSGEDAVIQQSETASSPVVSLAADYPDTQPEVSALVEQNEVREQQQKELKEREQDISTDAEMSIVYDVSDLLSASQMFDGSEADDFDDDTLKSLDLPDFLNYMLPAKQAKQEDVSEQSIDTPEPDSPAVNYDADLVDHEEIPVQPDPKEEEAPDIDEEAVPFDQYQDEEEEAPDIDEKSVPFDQFQDEASKDATISAQATLRREKNDRMPDIGNPAASHHTFTRLKILSQTDEHADLLPIDQSIAVSPTPANVDTKPWDEPVHASILREPSSRPGNSMDAQVLVPPAPAPAQPFLLLSGLQIALL